MLLVACGLSLVCDARAAAGAIHHLRIEGIINPIKARYVAQSIARAQAQGASLVLLSINTPGGLVSSMNEIVESITNSKIPIVGLVEPSSAQATSAGAFILLATDVAAMLPDTRMGAAHPVGADGELSETLDKKATNSLASLAKTLAKRRGRPEAIAEALVRESTSHTAQEARAAGVIELIVRDRNELLAKLDGYPLAFPSRTLTLATRNLRQVEVSLSFSDRMLDRIADPSIASILLSIGVLGIVYELAAPGIGLGGITGVISLLLGLLAVSALPIELAGVFLLLSGAVALGLEVFVPTHGLLGAGGVAALAVGALVLVDETSYFGARQAVDWRMVVPIAVVMGGSLVALAGAGRRALGVPPRTGVESLPGAAGTAKTPFVQQGGSFQGSVLVQGALWQATSDAALAPGDEIEIVQVRARPTRLHVKRNERGRI